MQLLFATSVLLEFKKRVYIFVATIQVNPLATRLQNSGHDTAQCIILIGVLVMSGSKCALFLEALDEEGGVIYFFG